jgi:hypothetical protein
VGPADAPSLTVAELIIRYWQFVRGYYVKDGRPTDSQDHIRLVMKALRRTYGHTPAVEFGPIALKAARQRMLDAGCGRKYINTQIRRVVQMFKWAVGEELVPQALQAVPGLRKHRTTAPEGKGVQSIEESIVEVIVEHLGPVVADMVRFQRLTGTRRSRFTFRPQPTASGAAACKGNPCLTRGVEPALKNHRKSLGP